MSVPARAFRATAPLCALLSAAAVLVPATAHADLVDAARTARVADKGLVASATRLGTCQTRIRTCNVHDAALQIAGRRAASSVQRLARLAETSGEVAVAARRVAPRLRLSAHRVSWTPVAGVNAYVLARKVPGQSDDYSVVAGTSASPPVFPGRRVTFSVRTAVEGSRWAVERSLTVPTSSRAGRDAAPVLVVRGRRLTWKPVADVKNYVLVAKSDGVPDAYSVVRGGGITPAAVPGQTVSYSLRTASSGSAWAVPRTIDHAPSPSPAPTPDAATSPSDEPRPAPTSARKQPTNSPAAQQVTPAPTSPTDRTTIVVDGLTLSWAPIPGASSYVTVAKTSGAADVYGTVSGTSVAPPPQPGRTVAYSVRANVDGALWALEQSIAYPTVSAGAPGPAPAPSPAPAPAGGTFTAGVVAGSALEWELPFVRTVGARSARMEFDINTPLAEIAGPVEAYARAGVQPLLLAGFNGRKPTTAEAAKLGAWASSFGPGGSFWAGKGLPARVAVRHIEFGNDSSYAWQYPQLNGDPNWANTAFYRELAMAYGQAFKVASAGIRSANPGVGLLAVGDTPGNWGTWMDGIFAAVPDFGSHVGGWTVHPYGPDWRSRVDSVTSKARAHGAPDSVPLFVTEFGFATDDGRCLSDNYGWNRCMTYAEAGTTLGTTIRDLRSTYGGRLQGVWLYQAHDQRSRSQSSDREHYFGGVTYEGEAKGAFTTAVQTFMASGT